MFAYWTMLLSERTIILATDVDSALRYGFVAISAQLYVSIDGAATFRISNEVAYNHLRRFDALVAVPC